MIFTVTFTADMFCVAYICSWKI